MQELKTVVQRCEDWPNGLVDAESLAEDVGLLPERIEDLANAGFWPHYRLDGGPPMFRKGESKTWAARNLMQRFEGEAPDLEFKVVVQPSGTVDSKPPEALHGLKGLTELTKYLHPPGVYFLCDRDQVVYVGQSVDPLARISAHRKDPRKQFNRVFFLAVPEFMLNTVERQFIELLRPVHNGNSGPGADERHVNIAKELIAQIGSSE